MNVDADGSFLGTKSMLQKKALKSRFFETRTQFVVGVADLRIYLERRSMSSRLHGAY